MQHRYTIKASSGGEKKVKKAKKKEKPHVVEIEKKKKKNMEPSFSGRYHLFFFSCFLLYLYVINTFSWCVLIYKLV